MAKKKQVNREKELEAEVAALTAELEEKEQTLQSWFNKAQELNSQLAEARKRPEVCSRCNALGLSTVSTSPPSSPAKAERCPTCGSYNWRARWCSANCPDCEYFETYCGHFDKRITCTDPWHDEDRCPKCGSDERFVRYTQINETIPGFAEAEPCRDPWHDEKPVGVCRYGHPLYDAEEEKKTGQAWCETCKTVMTVRDEALQPGESWPKEKDPASQPSDVVICGGELVQILGGKMHKGEATFTEPVCCCDKHYASDERYDYIMEEWDLPDGHGLFKNGGRLRCPSCPVPGHGLKRKGV